MARLLAVLAAAAVVAAPVAPARADPISPKDVPAPLKPWIGWALHGHEMDACTHVYGSNDATRCLWPGRLALVLDDGGGRFTQTWTVEHRAWVPLPGTSARPPEDVTVDGHPAVVYPVGGAPGVRIGTGRHVVAGRFLWKQIPEKLQVPVATALVDLTLRGKHVTFPQLDDTGWLWLQKRATPGAHANSLEVSVFRRLDDAVPFEVETRIDLDVSGEARQVTLGRALLPGFIPLDLSGPLPARALADGHLEVQVRPGHFTLTLTARAPGRVTHLSLPKPAGPWAPSEVWVFAAHPNLRIVDLSGLPSVDPSQTRLPGAWRNLPAYRVRPGDALTLKVRRRGDATPAPDSLTLARTLWLDFDGGGYTFHDRIGGTLHSGLRLSMARPSILGRVSVDGHDQLVTRLTKDGPAGVEVRRRHLDVVADGRNPGSASTLPAVGWRHGFQSVSETLNLPPGWRLLHATGVDEVPGTWVSRWSLLDLFLVLVLALVIGRLFGWGVGALALVTLVLVVPEAGAPRWILAFLLAGEALCRVVPAGWLLRVSRIYRFALRVALVVVAVPFVIHQVRVGTYPILEHPHRPVSVGAPAGGQAVDQTVAGGSGAANSVFGQGGLGGGINNALGGLSGKAGAPPPPAYHRGAVPNRYARMQLKAPSKSGWSDEAYRYQVSPNAAIQTGPGVPIWDWNQLSLEFDGPVAAGQQIHLWLVSPGWNLVLSILRVVLLAGLVLVLLGAGRFWRKWPLGRGAAAALLLALLVPAASARAQTIPDQDTLTALRKRLLAPPSCLPTCASMPSLAMTATPTQLTLTLEVDAAATTAVPLPGDANHFVPTSVTLDGKPATRLARGDDGATWIGVGPGRHTIVVAGPLPDRTSVQLPLPLHPGEVTTHLSGWTLVGLGDDGVADATLELDRTHAQGASGPTLEAGTLPSFAVVTRKIHLGLDWTVDTTVARDSFIGSAVVLSVPLLPGESVTTGGVHVKGGAVKVNLAPGAATTSWHSTLTPAPRLLLTAPRTTRFTEVWVVESSPVWHVTAKGIPPVHTADDDPVRRYRPWPGESLTLAVVQPKAVPGRSLTLDDSVLSETPGRRDTDVTLKLDLRSSRGGPHVITLPKDATLQSATLDGDETPLRQDGRKVTVPLSPGTDSVTLTWRESRGIGTRFETSTVDVGTRGVNAQVQLEVPHDRWILFAFGPRAGPAVLFWSLLAVVLVVAVLLGMVSFSPLKWWQWLLLGVGLTQVPVWMGILVTGWLLALGWRRRSPDVSPALFDLRQVGLAFWTLAALVALFFVVKQGLLGHPSMQVTGNGSTPWLMRWYQDRSAAALPAVSLVSVPMMVYRGAMLLWALWLAAALVGWLREGWAAFGEGGLWRKVPARAWVKRPAPPVPARPAPSPGDGGGG